MDMEEAVEKAVIFLKSGYPSHKLLLVNFNKSENEWKLKFDVGAILVVYIMLTIDDATGRIISYERQT